MICKLVPFGCHKVRNVRKLKVLTSYVWTILHHRSRYDFIKGWFCSHFLKNDVDLNFCAAFKCQVTYITWFLLGFCAIYSSSLASFCYKFERKVNNLHRIITVRKWSTHVRLTYSNGFVIRLKFSSVNDLIALYRDGHNCTRTKHILIFEADEGNTKLNFSSLFHFRVRGIFILLLALHDDVRKYR